MTTWLSTKDAAQLAQLHPNTLHRAAKHGHLVSRMIANRRCYTRASVLRYVASDRSHRARVMKRWNREREEKRG